MENSTAIAVGWAEGPCNRAIKRLLPGLKRLLGGTSWTQRLRQVPRVPPEERQQIVCLASLASAAGPIPKQRPSARGWISRKQEAIGKAIKPNRLYENE